MATVKLTKGYTDASVESWQCGDCDAQFVYIGAPNYCPECGEEFDKVDKGD